MAGIEAKVKITTEVDGTEKVTGLGKAIDGGLRPASEGGLHRSGKHRRSRQRIAARRRQGRAGPPPDQRWCAGDQQPARRAENCLHCLGVVQAAMGAVSGLAATADAWANLTAKVKMAVGEGDAFTQAFQGVQDVALRTGTSLEATGNLFVKLAEAGQADGGQARPKRCA